MFKNLIFLMELNKSTFFAIGDLLVRYNFLYINFYKDYGKSAVWCEAIAAQYGHGTRTGSRMHEELT